MKKRLEFARFTIYTSEMKFVICFLLISLVNCQPKVPRYTDKKETINIPFEDRSHYTFPLIKSSFLVIDTQEKMDGIFSIIHKKIGGGRLSPVLTVTEGETYIIIKPVLKDANDVTIENISLNNNRLTITVKGFENPNINEGSRVSPDILLKLSKTIIIKDIIITY